MILLSLFAVILGFILQIFFFYFSYLSVDLHQMCLAKSPQSSYQEFYQALICGKRLPGSATKQSIQNIGLIHLFVVSGAHLHFVDAFIRPLTKSPRWRFPLLFLFVITAALPMTALRAWIYLVLCTFSKCWKLHLPTHHCLLLSVLLGLSLQPEQFHSLSLPLSWMASLGILCGQSSMSQSIFVYLFTLPCLVKIHLLSPWSILINAFLAPTISLLLFPICMLTFVFQWLTPMTDGLWHLFFRIAENLQIFLKVLPVTWEGPSPIQLWALCLFCHQVSYYGLRRQ
jgi:competence protein ComEC